MQKFKSFYINRTEKKNGPSIFGYRLKQELINKGFKFNPLFPSVNYIFSSGLFRPFCKNILRLDGLYFDLGNTLGNSEKLNGPIFRAYKKTDAIVFQSEFNKKLFERFAGYPKCPAIVIPNGVTSDFSPIGERIDYGFKKTVICSSNWRIHKRLECIIKGFLEYGNQDVGLVVLGWGIEKQIEHPNIKYVGKINIEELPNYLRGGNAFIHLSWLDGCPNTVIEALACGLPVICSHNGGTKEVVRSNGIIIECEEDYNFEKVALFKPPKCDKRLVATAIEKILNWPNTIEAEYLKIDRIADKYIEFTESIM